ncbi:helix-turn-helix domain-containing protein [Microvirga thermotolerans]|uniref:Helix-turn-helix domain-containing protein n=1 Tax=Microvirga thermotolerans TaxID=2651334 RepID=A0A5P9K2V6_9HYPH|nr:helix-turn-helix domain-containing protein [Microvirga thermotolerans]QFU16564.1 helix-turn-helix domain-containing protein [Microvirga thermotolerans]
MVNKQAGNFQGSSREGLDYFTISEFCAWTRLSRATVYRAIRASTLNAKKLGGRTIILREDAVAFVKGLPSA